jgi:hypothetical protein
MSERFPHGKISTDDEGELNIAIAADRSHNVVRIHFGKSIYWLGLDVETAEAFVKILEAKIDELKAGPLEK